MPLVVSYPLALAKGRRVGAAVELVGLYATLQECLAPDQAVPGRADHSAAKGTLLGI